MTLLQRYVIAMTLIDNNWTVFFQMGTEDELKMPITSWTTKWLVADLKC